MARKHGNREGSLYFRTSDSKWVGALTLIDGRRKVFYGATQEEARRKLAKAIHDRDQGLHAVTDGRQTVERYLSDWLIAMKTRVRESTWLSYEHRLRLYVIPAIGTRTMIKLLPSDLSRLYTRPHRHEVPFTLHCPQNPWHHPPCAQRRGTRQPRPAQYR